MSRPEGSQNQNYGGVPSLRGSKITGVRKDENDAIQAFQLETGEIVGYEEAISIVDSGESSGIIAQEGRTKRILRSWPDGYDSNDLDNLPEFK